MRRAFEIEKERGINMKKVSVLGYGTVGSGVVEILRENAELIEKRAGEKIQVKYRISLSMILRKSGRIPKYRL